MEEAERLRVREADLIHARDRALARAAALEVANAAWKDAVRRLAAQAPDPTPAPDARPLAEVVYADELDLPAALLAGRDVFFFTGQVRRPKTCVRGGALVATYPENYGTECFWDPSNTFQGWSKLPQPDDAIPYYASLMLQFECFSYSKVVDSSGKTQVSCSYWGANP